MSPRWLCPPIEGIDLIGPGSPLPVRMPMGGSRCDIPNRVVSASSDAHVSSPEPLYSGGGGGIYPNNAVVIVADQTLSQMCS